MKLGLLADLVSTALQPTRNAMEVQSPIAISNIRLV
jgi:hypothetical protein